MFLFDVLRRLNSSLRMQRMTCAFWLKPYHTRTRTPIISMVITPLIQALELLAFRRKLSIYFSAGIFILDTASHNSRPVLKF